VITGHCGSVAAVRNLSLIIDDYDAERTGLVNFKGLSEWILSR
jgi:hypothetical protein